MALKKQKKKNISNRIISVVLLGVIAFSGYNLYTGFQDYWKDYEKSLQINEDASRNQKTVNWKKLRKKNKDVIGWIYCPGTVIDYPIVQGKDNDTYLHTGVDGTWSGAGTLFVDCANEDPFQECNTVIYGHHMRDGSMFHDLDDWKDKNHLKKHPVFYLYTPTQNYELKILCWNNVSATDTNVYGVPFDEEAMGKYIEMIKKAPVKTKEASDISEADSFVTLSTCAYTFKDARSILACKVVPVDKSIQDIESSKPKPDSKFTVFCRMIKEIIIEGISDIQNGESE